MKHYCEKLIVKVIGDPFLPYQIPCAKLTD